MGTWLILNLKFEVLTERNFVGSHTFKSTSQSANMIHFFLLWSQGWHW